MRASERGVLIRGLVADVFLGEDEEVGPRCSDMEAGWPTPEFAGERCRIFLLLFFFFFEGLLLPMVNFFLNRFGYVEGGPHVKCRSAIGAG